MTRWASLLMLPWALWAHVETTSVPAVGTPLVQSDVMERFESYQGCTKAAEWAEAQSDMREDWTVDVAGNRWHSTMTYECRQGEH